MALPLHTIAFIQPNLYKDSVALMRVAQRLLAMPDVVNATLQMGNPANREILQEAGLLGSAVKDAGPSDIMVVVQARTRAACEAASAESKAQLESLRKLRDTRLIVLNRSNFTSIKIQVRKWLEGHL